MSQQKTLMKYDPASGRHHPYPSHAEQYRIFHGNVAWLFNPWTGERRNAADVGSDLFGMLIIPDGEPLSAFKPEFNQAEFDEMVDKGTKAWADVPNATEFVENLRGNDV